MGASISNRFNRTAQGLWMVLLGIPLLVAYGAGLILIIIGAIRMRGSGRANKIRKKGQEAYGLLSYKIMEHDEKVTLLTKKRVVFYYKLSNGLLGRTSESINKKMHDALEKCGNNIPIKVLDNQAALDRNRLFSNEESKPNVDDLDFSSQDPSYRYKYGEMTKKSVVLLILAGVFFVINQLSGVIALVYSKAVSSSESLNSFTLIPIVLGNYLSLILTLLFFFLGMRKMAFYGLASKIRKDGNGDNKIGTLIPVSNRNGGTLLVLPNKATFQYVAENGLLIQTEQVINKKMFNKIMEKGEREIPYIELNNYAVIDNKETLGKEPTKLDKFFAFIKKYHIFFWFAVIANIYFFTTELVHSINNGFTDGISIFSLAMYFLTLIYISLMELLGFKGKAGNFAYIMTILFLSCNIVATIATLAIGFMNIGITFVHTSVVNFFGLGTIYFFYIICISCYIIFCSI